MRRLRKSRPYGQRSRPEGGRKPEKVFVISTEGTSTEVNYFHGFNEHGEELGIKGRVIIDILERQDPNDTKSAPEYILGLLNEYVDESGIDSDELWIVFDRDKQNNSAEQVIATINHCQDNGYNIGLSNPCFEIWLLMHVSDLKEYTSEQLLNNPKPRLRSKRRFIDSEISKKMGGYDKSNLIFKRFLPGLQDAVDVSEQSCSEPLLLVKSPGTSVGKLVEEILSTCI